MHKNATLALKLGTARALLAPSFPRTMRIAQQPAIDFAGAVVGAPVPVDVAAICRQGGV